MTLVRAMLIGIVVTVGNIAAAGDATPGAFSCPVTEPIEERPDRDSDPFPDSAALHYSDGLWVSIPEDGSLELTPDDEIKFGPMKGWRSITVIWLREDGVEGFVEVTGQRLDAESEFSPQTPLSPQRQYVRVGPVTTGLAFPSEGCWEVTGFVREREITFVVDVRFVDELVATPAS